MNNNSHHTDLNSEDRPSSPSTAALSSSFSGRQSHSTSESTFAEQTSLNSRSVSKHEGAMATAAVPPLAHEATWPTSSPLPSHRQQHDRSMSPRQREETARVQGSPNGRADQEVDRQEHRQHTYPEEEAQTRLHTLQMEETKAEAGEARATYSDSPSPKEASPQYGGGAIAPQQKQDILTPDKSPESMSHKALPSITFESSPTRRPPSRDQFTGSSDNQGSPTRYASHALNYSQSTAAGGSSGWSQLDMFSRDGVSTAGGHFRQPVQSRFFGLGPNLQAQTTLVDPAFFPGGILPPGTNAPAALDTDEGGSSPGESPTFSVELKARSFDHRGYPVYGGRAALISGVIRMPRSEESDVVVKISAHATSGSTATIWDGIALQPATNASERTIFSTTDTFQASEGHIDYIRTPSSVPSPSTSNASTKCLAEAEDDGSILVIPFTTNLPVGGSTKVIDGEVATVAVPLPPSFEMSSEQDIRDKAVLKSMGDAVSGSSAATLASGAASVRTSRTRMTATSVKEAVEAGLRQVYSVGCFYRITFTLSPIATKAQEGGGRKLAGAIFGSKKSKAARKLKGSRVISVPFVFLGEISPQPPTPSILPPIRPAILKQPSQPLAQNWVSDVATAKWSGMFFKPMKRSVELELFLPSRTVQAPGVVPVLLVIRPEDPGMLPKPLSSAATAPSMGPSTLPGYSRTTSTDDAALLYGSHDHSSPSNSVVSPGSALGLRPASNSSHADRDGKQQPGGLTRMMHSAMSISDSPAHATSASNHSVPVPGSSPPNRLLPKLSRSNFSFSRRPDTAVSRASSEESTMSYTIRGGSSLAGEGASACGLPALIRLSILQNVYYSSSNVNEPPKNKRRLMDVAELEEIDLVKLAEGRNLGPDLSLLQDTPDAISLVEEAKTSGVRLLRGVLRIPREATPSFRVQGIEVKYAIKVDLLSLNSRSAARPKSSGGQQGGGASSISDRSNSSAMYATGISSGCFMHPSSSSSPPVTPPFRPSPQFGASSTGGKILHQHHPQQQVALSSSGSSQYQGSGSVASHNPHTVWAPGAAVPLGLHQHSYEASAARMSQALSTTGSSVSGSAAPRPRLSIDASEAGFSRRTPSDPTIVGSESSKLHKTVGALWVNVRLVKGKGSL